MGRPRTYNRDDALNSAMLTFWRHGYESTSIALLCSEMHINAPSLYASFGDKKSLFLEALDRYVGSLEDLRDFINDKASAFEAAEQLLQLSVARFTGPDTPKGCMLASAVSSVSAESTDVQAVAARIRMAMEGYLRDRIRVDREAGVLPASTSEEGLAAMTLAVIQGLSVLARDGANRQKLMQIAKISMAAWNPIGLMS